jgi:hypothetical protein
MNNFVRIKIFILGPRIKPDLLNFFKMWNDNMYLNFSDVAFYRTLTNLSKNSKIFLLL